MSEPNDYFDSLRQQFRELDFQAEVDATVERILQMSYGAESPQSSQTNSDNRLGRVSPGKVGRLRDLLRAEGGDS